MAIALVQIKTAAATSLTLTSPTTAGNCLVVGFTDEAGTSSVSAVKLGGVADNFAQLSSAAASPGKAGEVLAALWADPNCAGGQTAVAVTPFSSANSPTMWAAEFSGIVASSPLDKQVGATGTAASWSSGSTATTAQATELWVGAVCTGASSGTGPSSPWNNTTVTDLSGDGQIYGYQIVSSTGAAVYSGTNAGFNDGWAAVVATLKGASSSTPSGTVQPEATFPTARRKRVRAGVRFTPVSTTNPSGPAGTVQPETAVPAPRRKPARAWLKFTPVVNTGILSGPAGRVQPETAVPAPRRRRARAWLRFTPVATTNATGSSGRVQPEATVPTPRRRRLRAISAGIAVPGIRSTAPRQEYQTPPRRKRQRAWVKFTPVAGAIAGRDLLIALAAEAGTDDYGNTFPQGIFASAGVIEGPTIIGSDAFYYSPAPGFGNLTQTISQESGTDQYGNAYLAGTATYANNSNLFWSAVVIIDGNIHWYKADGPGGPWTFESGIAFGWNDLTGGSLIFEANAGTFTSGDLTVNGNATVTTTLTVSGTDVGATLSAIIGALSGASTSTNGLSDGTISGSSGGQVGGAAAHTHGPGSYSVTSGQHHHTLPNV